MAQRVIPLGDPASADSSVVGAKAAGLSKAAAAGLPVVGGFALTADVSLPTLQLAAETLAERGSGAARLDVMRAKFDTEVFAELRQATEQMAEPLIVRSSSVLEGSGEWSGAFASLAELRREEVPKAVRSMWAGMFSLETLERFAAAGIQPEEAPIGALIQSEIEPEFGGSARVSSRGTVSLSAVAGSPRDLLAGWCSGAAAHVAPNGEVSGQEALTLLGIDLLRKVANLARRSLEELGCGLIEWAALDGKPVLLQVQRTATELAHSPGEESGLPAALGLEGARELARLVVQYPGALGEEMVLGWRAAWDETGGATDETGGATDETRKDTGGAADGSGSDAGSAVTAGTRGAAAGGTSSAVPRRGASAGELLERARRLAAELTASAWGRPPEQAVPTAAAALRRLRGDRPNESLEALGNLGTVDPHLAAEMLEILEAIAAELPQPERIWYYTSEELEAVLSGTGAAESGRVGRDRWEPFLAGVAALSGEARSGLAGGSGMGAGRLCWVSEPSATSHVRARDVIVLQYPLANFAPLLWDAAGLITLGGAPSAHLLEVARSLAVPAVVGCPIADLLGSTAEASRAGSSGELRIAAVDGDEGRVAVLKL